jgi:hypothetical protein
MVGAYMGRAQYLSALYRIPKLVLTLLLLFLTSADPGFPLLEVLYREVERLGAENMSMHNYGTWTSQATTEMFHGHSQHPVDTIFLSTSLSGMEIEKVRQLQPAMKQLRARCGLDASSNRSLSMTRP